MSLMQSMVGRVGNVWVTCPAALFHLKKIRSLRLLARYRTKTARQIASEKNRMLKILDFSGIRLTYAMSKADCVSGMAMIEAIANGETSVKKLDVSCQRVFTSEDRRIFLCPVRKNDGR